MNGQHAEPPGLEAELKRPTARTPWTYSRSENGRRDYIEDADGNMVVFDIGHLDGPLIVNAVNRLPLEALREIAEHTDPDSEEENYHEDDTEGCLDTVYGIATAALAATEKGGE